MAACAEQRQGDADCEEGRQYHPGVERLGRERQDG